MRALCGRVGYRHVRRWAVGIGLMAAAGAPAGQTVTVTAPKAALSHAPVTLALPDGLDPNQVRLTDQKSGAPVVTQADQTPGGKKAISWLVDALAANASAIYLLESGTPANLPQGQGVQLTETDKGLDIAINGKFFTTYQTDNGPKPYCWPIIGPTGTPITRDFPMKVGTRGERPDHKHHRSFWFTHDKINGNDFWSEMPTAGKSIHREFLEVTSGPVFGQFASRVDWMSREGEKVCDDVRTLRVYNVTDVQLIDCAIRLKAGDEPLVIGDSKEGTFAFRVAGTMKVEQPGGKPGGTITNANGERDQDAWGKRAAWCDYSGPVQGETVGIAILDNPHNLRHPTYWHVRTYGLFAANPFGISHFTGDKSQDGSYTIPAGESLDLSYRVYIHPGGCAEAGVAATYAAYADPPMVTVSGNDGADRKDESAEAGFKKLFNGVDLTGWREVQGLPGSFSVSDGVLIGNREAGGRRTAYWLSTEQKYANFVVRLDYQLPAGGNSGVFLRVPHYLGRSSKLGMEIQLLDDGASTGAPTAGNTGSIYRVVAPKAFVAHPAGAWNELEIRCDGDRVTVTLNGERITDAHMAGYEELKDRPREGYLGLSAHTHDVKFKNIRLRELPAGP